MVGNIEEAKRKAHDMGRRHKCRHVFDRSADTGEEFFCSEIQSIILPCADGYMSVQKCTQARL